MMHWLKQIWKIGCKVKGCHGMKKWMDVYFQISQKWIHVIPNSILKPAFHTHHYSRLRTQTTFFLLILFDIKNNPPIRINNVKIFANKSVIHPPYTELDTICLKEMESKLEMSNVLFFQVMCIEAANHIVYSFMLVFWLMKNQFLTTFRFRGNE